jgi:chromosome segregation ATPase
MSDNFSIDGLPEETQNYIRSLRSEAAKYRTERNEVQTKLTEVTTKYAESASAMQAANTKLDELSAIKDASEKNAADLAKLTALRERETIAWSAGLTVEDAARLQGANADELKADAEKLAARLGTKGRVPIPKDGAAPESGKTDDVGNEDPIKKAFRDAGLLN